LGGELGIFDSLFGRPPRDLGPGFPTVSEDEWTAVWNRACAGLPWPPSLGPSAREGDVHLAYVVIFDSFAIGDGLLDAMSHMGSDGTRQVVESFRWLGLPRAAKAVECAWDRLLPAGVEWTPDMDIDFDVLNVESMTDAQLSDLEQATATADAAYGEAASDLEPACRDFYTLHRDLFAPATTA